MTSADRALVAVARTWGLLLPLAVIVPAFLPGVGVSREVATPGLHRLMEWLLLGTAGITLIAGAQLRRVMTGDLSRIWPAAGFLVSVGYVTIAINALPLPASDFLLCFGPAAEAVGRGISPWAGGVDCYIYPPTLAWALAAASDGAHRVLGLTSSPDSVMAVTFYVFSVVQMVLAAAFYLGLYMAGRRGGMSPTAAAVASAALIVVGVPVQESLLAQQVNMLLPVAALAAVVLVPWSSAAAGLSLAVGALVKVYPAALVPVWWWSGERRAAIWAVVWGGGLALLIAPWSWWMEFVSRMTRPGGYPPNTDFSLYSVIANGARVLGVADPAVPPAWASVVAGLGGVLAVIWLVVRLGSRRSVLHHTADVLAISLFLSPIVWRHHLVLLYPLIMVTAPGVASDRRVWFALGLACALVVPSVLLAGSGVVFVGGVSLILWATNPEPDGQR